MNVVAYSLWGTDPTYRAGALRNIDLVREHYGPAWVCRFYLFPSTYDMEDELRSAGAETVRALLTDEREGLFARMSVAFDVMVSRFVIRDTDSRPSRREAELVREWIRSGKAFHTIADHRRHTSPVMGGMWGAIRGALPETFPNMYENWLNATRAGTAPYHRAAAGRYGRWSDQSFLTLVLWPTMSRDCCTHDQKALAALRDGEHFIGQQWHVVDGKEVPQWVR
jgi:hypothetical protein